MLLKRTADFIVCTLKHQNVYVCESIVCVQMAMLRESVWLCISYAHAHVFLLLLMAFCFLHLYASRDAAFSVRSPWKNSFKLNRIILLLNKVK